MNSSDECKYKNGQILLLLMHLWVTVVEVFRSFEVKVQIPDSENTPLKVLQ